MVPVMGEGSLSHHAPCKNQTNFKSVCRSSSTYVSCDFLSCLQERTEPFAVKDVSGLYASNQNLFNLDDSNQ